MKRLNFAPYYKPYLAAGDKTTTLRMGNSEALTAGDVVMLTVGWHEGERDALHRARITEVVRKPVGALSAQDLAGESPDCRTAEAARLAMSCIYGRVVGDDDPVYVIHFEHPADQE